MWCSGRMAAWSVGVGCSVWSWLAIVFPRRRLRSIAHSVVSAEIDATPGVSAAMAPSVVSAMVVDPFFAAMAPSVVSAAIDFFSDVQISWPWRQGCQTQVLRRLRIELFVDRI